MQFWPLFAADTASFLDDLVSLADEGIDVVSMLRDCRRRHPNAKWRLISGHHDGHEHWWPTERHASREGTGAHVLVALVGTPGPSPLGNGFALGDSPLEEARRATLRAIGEALDIKAHQDLNEAQRLRPGECEADFVEIEPHLI